MNDQEFDAVIKNVFKEAFDVSPSDVADETRRGDLERWDSLGHLDLVAVLSQKFQIEIPPEDALDMETVADIKRIVKRLQMVPNENSDANAPIQRSCQRKDSP